MHLILSFFLFFVNAPELIIGKEKVPPGIVFIFEGAVKDQIIPDSYHLKKHKTNVHIEARVNWDNKNIPKGTPSGGFIPYLYITATLTNESSGLQTFVDLKPHINLIDNFHYARNISLPGSVSDLYSVEFNVTPPSSIELTFHNDWVKMYGEELFSGKLFKYNGVDFEEIANASRD